MSNEIKFRIWDFTYCKMFYPTDGGYAPSNYFSLGVDLQKSRLSYPHKLLQYTGAPDRKGKEIILGDLLNIGSNVFGFVVDKDGKNAIYEVQKQGCDYVLYRHDTKLMWGRLSRLEELVWECEIVGNIYENPELINQK